MFVAGRDYTTIPPPDSVGNISIVFSSGDQRVCFQLLSVNKSMPDTSVRQNIFTFMISSNTSTIIPLVISHKLYVLYDGECIIWNIVHSAFGVRALNSIDPDAHTLTISSCTDESCYCSLLVFSMIVILYIG